MNFYGDIETITVIPALSRLRQDVWSTNKPTSQEKKKKNKEKTTRKNRKKRNKTVCANLMEHLHSR